jgi:hypothetical protein
MAAKTSRVATRKQATAVVDGHWTGDAGAFVDWCVRATELDAYKTALAGVPPNYAWASVLRSLHSDIEFVVRPSDTAPRVDPIVIFREHDDEGAELRDAKRKILEAEITRRALGAH